MKMFNLFYLPRAEAEVAMVVLREFEIEAFGPAIPDHFRYVEPRRLPEYFRYSEPRRTERLEWWRKSLTKQGYVLGEKR